MGLSDNALQALTEELGEEYLSTDPAVMRTYARNFTSALGVRPPACVALPGKMEDIQEIYRLANRFDFKVIPTGSHLFMSCEPQIPFYDYLIIDPKRMDGIWKVSKVGRDIKGGAAGGAYGKYRLHMKSHCEER